jgi:hypothetical protein
VGYIPYTGCFNPPRTNWPRPGNPCVRDTAVAGVANVMNLTGSAGSGALETEISQTQARLPGSGTNICWPLRRARQMLAETSQSGNVKQFVVLMADGNNVYNADVVQGSASPPGNQGSCRPNDASNDAGGFAGCNETDPYEADLDILTRERADDLESDDVEIYVVGFNVCSDGGGGEDCRGAESDPGACPTVSDSECAGAIGEEGGSSGNSPRHDNHADRRLLKCIASSSPGTNDHYFEVEDADDLLPIFQIVAFEIAGRGLTDGN